MASSAEDKELITLCSHDECTGCMACEGVCPKNAIITVFDEEGFRHPMIDHDACIRCHLCQKTCPVLNPVDKNDDGEVYAAWSKDDGIRMKSSSGGLFSELALAVLNDGGKVVGASMFQDNMVRHIIVNTPEELSKLRGSKYVQSDLSRELYHEIGELLKQGTTVLFSGTPCQVAGVLNMFKRYREQLITVDVVCHGVPSPLFYQDFANKLKKKYPNLVSYQFRDYERWLVCVNVNVNVNVNDKTIKRYLYGEDTFYQDAFLKGLLHRPNCYKCQYATIQRVSDITLADFWGIGKKIPIDPDYKRGTSMASLNTEAGKRLFDRIKDGIFATPRDIQETIDGGNEQLVKSSSKPEGRDDFYRDAKTMSVSKLVKKYHLSLRQAPPTKFGKIKRKIKKILLRN